VKIYVTYVEILRAICKAPKHRFTQTQKIHSSRYEY
jgi:hypothetical protein